MNNELVIYLMFQWNGLCGKECHPNIVRWSVCLCVLVEFYIQLIQHWFVRCHWASLKSIHVT